MKDATGSSLRRWKMGLNPMEWLSWLYGKFFTNHTILSYFLVGSLGLLVALILWTKAIDKYREEHPIHSSSPVTTNPTTKLPEPVPTKSGSATTTGPQSPAVTGDGNSITYGEPSESKKTRSKPPK